MIKINLLPPHVVEKRKVRSLAVLLLALLLVELGGFFFYYSTLVRTEKAKNDLYAETKAEADVVRGMQAQAVAELEAAKPLLDKVGWYDKIYQNNGKIADTLGKINEYLYAKMTVRSISVNGGQVNIQASTKDLDHVASAYLNLLRSPYITPARQVSFSPSLRAVSPGPANRGAPVTPGAARGTGPGAMRQMNPGGAAMPGRVQPASAQPASSGSANPNELMAVSFSFTLKPEYALTGGGGSGSGIGTGRPGGRPGGTSRPSRGPAEGDPRYSARLQER
jgi:hypothetical protein